MTDAADQLRAALEDRLRFEALISDIASHFVNLDSDLIGGCIEEAQRRLVEALQVDRSSLFQLSDADGAFVFTHSWSAPGSPPVPMQRGATIRQFPWALSQTLKGDLVCFSSLDEVPADAPDRAAFQQAGVKSNVTLPLIVAGRVIGSLAFSATQQEREWAPEIVGRLRLVAQVFASALARTRGQAELRHANEERVGFETLIADLSSEFVNLDSSGIDGAIEDAQRRLVEALGIDRSTLFQVSDTERKLVFSHSWSRPGLDVLVPPGSSSSRFPWMVAQILQGERVCFSSVGELPPDAADREELQRLGTKSNVTVPLIVSGRVIGALTFASVREERQWPPEVVNRLTLVGQVFAGALARKRTEADLRRTLDENARLRDRLTQENVYLQREVKERRGNLEIIGQSRAIQHLLEQVVYLAQEEVDVHLSLRLSPQVATRAAAKMLQMDVAEVAPEDAESFAGEVVNMIAGRVKAVIAAQGGSANFSLPKIGVIDKAEPGPADVSLSFDTAARGMSMLVTLRAMDRRAMCTA